MMWMKRYTVAAIIGVTVLLMLTLSLTAAANSSWHWISKMRPYDLMPLAAAVTLALETVLINRFARLQNTKKVFSFVLFANVLSFAAPYLFEHATSGGIYTFDRLLDAAPIYTVGIVYLVMTLIVEVPVVYAALRKDAQKKTVLLWTIIGSNVLTTAAVLFMERTLCYGQW